MFTGVERRQFPDTNKNYQETVVEPARRAEEARIAAEKAEAERLAAEATAAAQAAYVARMPVPSGTCAYWMAVAGITDKVNAYTLIMKESGCSPYAVNQYSGACGIGQQLPCGKWPHAWNDPVGGLVDMQNYVYARYGSWANALGFHYSVNWY